QRIRPDRTRTQATGDADRHEAAGRGALAEVERKQAADLGRCVGVEHVFQLAGGERAGRPGEERRIGVVGPAGGVDVVDAAQVGLRRVAPYVLVVLGPAGAGGEEVGLGDLAAGDDRLPGGGVDDGVDVGPLDVRAEVDLVARGVVHVV